MGRRQWGEERATSRGSGWYFISAHLQLPDQDLQTLVASKGRGSQCHPRPVFWSEAHRLLHLPMTHAEAEIGVVGCDVAGRESGPSSGSLKLST